MDFEFTSGMVTDLIQNSFGYQQFEPNSNIALFNGSETFIHMILNTPSIKPSDKSFLLSICGKLRTGSFTQIHFKQVDKNLDVSEWFPDKTFIAFQKEISEGSYYIHDQTKDLDVGIGGAYVKWKSKSNKNIDIIAVVASKICENISVNKWALKFDDNTLYKIEGISLRKKVTVCMCITFRYEQKHGEQDIIFDRRFRAGDSCRGLSISDRNLRIWGANNPLKYHSILMKEKVNWITAYIEWPEKDSTPGRYIIYNNESGEFTATTFEESKRDIIYIGCGDPVRAGLKGSIASLNIFYKPSSVIQVPKHLIDLVMKKSDIK